jgi:hippurate hydrolase
METSKGNPLHGSVNLGDIVDKHLPKLERYYDIYKDLHQQPELGKQEIRTANIAAEELRRLGYEVQTKIGGTGVVGLLKNGEGKTILLRADMDALPIKEATGLP